jgi:hypothetical protein
MNRSFSNVFLTDFSGGILLFGLKLQLNNLILKVLCIVVATSCYT